MASNSIVHYFFVAYHSGGNIVGWFHQAIDKAGNLGVQSALPGTFPSGHATDLNTQGILAFRAIVQGSEILMPFIDANGHPSLLRGNAQTLNPTFTAEQVSSETVPFNGDDSYSPSIAADGLTGTLYYTYTWVDFSTRDQLMLCTNSGSGWSAPSVLYDAIAHPPANDPGITSQSIQFAAIAVNNGRISVGLGLQQEIIFPRFSENWDSVLHSIVAGLPYQVDVNQASVLGGNAALPVLLGQDVFLFSDVDWDSNQNRVPTLRAWSSKDGGKTWVQQDSANAIAIGGLDSGTFIPSNNRWVVVYEPGGSGTINAVAYFDLRSLAWILVNTTFAHSSVPPLSGASPIYENVMVVIYQDGSYAFATSDADANPPISSSSSWFIQYFSATGTSGWSNGFVITPQPDQNISWGGGSGNAHFVLDEVMPPVIAYLTLAFKGMKVYPQ